MLDRVLQDTPCCHEIAPRRRGTLDCAGMLPGDSVLRGRLGDRRERQHQRRVRRTHHGRLSVPCHRQVCRGRAQPAAGPALGGASAVARGPAAPSVHGCCAGPAATRQPRSGGVSACLGQRRGGAALGRAWSARCDARADRLPRVSGAGVPCDDRPSDGVRLLRHACRILQSVGAATAADFGAVRRHARRRAGDEDHRASSASDSSGLRRGIAGVARGRRYARRLLRSAARHPLAWLAGVAVFVAVAWLLVGAAYRFEGCFASKSGAGLPADAEVRAGFVAILVDGSRGLFHAGL